METCPLAVAQGNAVQPRIGIGGRAAAALRRNRKPGNLLKPPWNAKYAVKLGGSARIIRTGLGAGRVTEATLAIAERGHLAPPVILATMLPARKCRKGIFH
jgi:hypothetical protein